MLAIFTDSRFFEFILDDKWNNDLLLRVWWHFFFFYFKACTGNLRVVVFQAHVNYPIRHG